MVCETRVHNITEVLLIVGHSLVVSRHYVLGSGCCYVLMITLRVLLFYSVCTLQLLMIFNKDVNCGGRSVFNKLINGLTLEATKINHFTLLLSLSIFVDLINVYCELSLAFRVISRSRLFWFEDSRLNCLLIMSRLLSTIQSLCR